MPRGQAWQGRDITQNPGCDSNSRSVPNRITPPGPNLRRCAGAIQRTCHGGLAGREDPELNRNYKEVPGAFSAYV